MAKYILTKISLMKPKKYWNYRIITKLYKNSRFFSIVEVHYNNKVPRCYGEPDNLKNAENIEDLKWAHKKIKKAFKKPILDGDNFPKKFKKKSKIIFLLKKLFVY